MTDYIYIILLLYMFIHSSSSVTRGHATTSNIVVNILQYHANIHCMRVIESASAYRIRSNSRTGLRAHKFTHETHDTA